MEVIKGGAQEKIFTLPKPPAHLDRVQKSKWREVGQVLVDAGVLKATHLLPLEKLVVYYSFWIWAVKQINELNKKAPGSGLKQTFKSGASNVTTEFTILEKAAASLTNCIALFGLDPISEKKLKGVADPAQLDMWEEFNKAYSS